MILAITEINAWERERWAYVTDMFMQDAETINNLMIFVRLANAHFEEVKEAATREAGDVFAASKYWLRFYDDIEYRTDSVKLISRNATDSIMYISRDMGGYKGNTVDLYLKLSARKVKSAMVAMRDKKENLFYKNFEDAFLKRKYHTKTS